VSEIPKIGYTYTKLLENLGIITIRDLLYHLPNRYEKFDSSLKISDFKEGLQVTVVGEIMAIDNIFTRTGKKITKAKIRDETGNCEVIWFNQPYLAKSLKVAEYYRFIGKVGVMGKKFNLTSPKYEKVENGGEMWREFLTKPKIPATSNSSEVSKELGQDLQQIISVYPETKGITSKFLSQKIKYSLENAKIYEILPPQILETYGYKSLTEVLSNLHFPKSLDIDKRDSERLAYEELFLELLRVEERKKLWKNKRNSFKMRHFEEKLSILENSLPFKLTESQITSIREICSDLIKEHPMNRILEGDVGTGKTLVAVFASYLAVLNQYKTLYLAPTEILAKQHFETFKKYLGPLGVKIVLKTSSSKVDLKENDFDICIGTHAILYDYSHLQKLALVIIDEQHRFGVEQRSKMLGIYEHQTTPNLLTMTATPIPRTLALTLYGELDISILKTPPNTNKKITTYVIYPKKRLDMYEWISKKQEQTFVVCPFVDESEHEELSYVKAAVKEYEELTAGPLRGKRVGLLHGRLKPTEKQSILDKFRNKELDVLISTPVIEVGVDIPDASIIVIESAERYGLASLHQLRGRVGRGEKEGFCVIIPSHTSKTAYERLKNMEKVNNGLELAEIDLKLRGEGDLAGLNQSGFKSFKFASLSNLTMLENAKRDAVETLNRIQNFPELQKVIDLYIKKSVGNN
jgi:ATP-dependent DNA helicase RecG